MHRFIAFAWQPDGTRDATVRGLVQRLCCEQPDWVATLTRDGLVVLHAGFDTAAAKVYPLVRKDEPTQLGVVLGKVFDRTAVDTYRLGDDAPANPALAGPHSHAVVATCGQHLIDQFWGRYVALWTDPATRTHFVLRDPSGALPCFFTDHQGISIFFSHMEDCDRLGCIRFCVDWQHVARILHFGFSHRDHTGLAEVSNLLPGHCRKMGPQTSRTYCCWNTVELAREPTTDRVEEATALLHRTAVACVGAWASCYRSIVHRLSGGLDSTLVLSSLMQARQAEQVRCLHYRGRSADSEECRHARLAARHAEVELVEHLLDDPVVGGDQLATMPKSAVPLDYHYGLGAARFEARLARQTGAEAFFSGHGGDEVLNANNTPYSAVDFVLQHGLRPSLLTAALDAALLSRTSLWSVLSLVLRHGALRRRLDPLAPSSRLFPPHAALHASVTASLDVCDIRHPALDHAELPPGKLLHVFAVHTADMNSALAPAADRVEQVHPLYSQPLIELCLGLPTHLLSVSGMNRGLARRAFSRHAPAKILARSSKASGDGHHERIAVGLGAFIREYLVDGVLAEQGLLDRRGIEQALSGDRSAATSARSQLLSFVYLEDWVRRWVS